MYHVNPIPPDLPPNLLRVVTNPEIISKSDKSLSILLERFVNENDEPMKNCILLFLSTYAENIFKNNLYNFDKLYEALLSHLPQCSFVFQGQIFVQLTTMALTLELIHANRERFESFVNELMLVISKANQSQDRVLRQMAAECLHEIEKLHPGLLEPHMKYLYALCQKECTHALQSYVNLLMRILVNKIRLAGSSSSHRTVSSGEMSTTSGESLQSTLSTGSVAVKQKFQSFTIPSHVIHRQSGEATEQKLSEVDVEKLRLSSSKRIQKLVKDTRKILSFVMTASRYFTVWGKAEVFRGLFDLVKFSDFPLDAVRAEFFRKCVYSNNIYMVHVFSEMQKKFKFEGVSRERNGRCIWIAKDYLLSPFYRQLGSLLVTKNPRKINDITPTVHDNLLTVHTKLVRMVSSFSKPPNAAIIKRCLTVVSDFEYYFEQYTTKRRGPRMGRKRSKLMKPNLRLMIIVDFLYEILDVFPSSKTVVLNYLLNLTRSTPKEMIPWLIKFIDRFEKDHPKRSIQKSILRTLEKNIRFSHSSFLAFVPLIQRILSDPQFQPEDLLHQIDRFVKGYDPLKDVYSTALDISKSGEWKMGRATLECLTTAIRTHKSRIFDQVNPTLQYITKYYQNEDVRDQAIFLLKLANHIPEERLDYFLTAKNRSEIVEEEGKNKEEKEGEEEEVEGEKEEKEGGQEQKGGDGKAQQGKEGMVGEGGLAYERIEELDSYETANSSVKKREFQSFLLLKRVNLNLKSAEKEDGEDEVRRRFKEEEEKRRKKKRQQQLERRSYRVSDFETYHQLLFEMSDLGEELNFGTIVLFFSISFDKVKEDPEIDTIYSLRIYFPKLPQFEEIPEIRVPYLRSSHIHSLGSSRQQRSSTETNSGVGCTYYFRLPIQPLYPVRSHFKDIKVEFSTKKFVKCVTSVIPIEIELTDFFLKIPVNVTNELGLWRILWRDESFFESVKILTWRKYEVLRFISKRLSEFVVEKGNEDINMRRTTSATRRRRRNVGISMNDEDLEDEGEEYEEGYDDDEEEDDEEDDDLFTEEIVKKKKENDVEIKKVMVFLPPKYHLLMWFVIGEMNTKVKIKTDLFQVLAYLDDFFNTF